MSISVSSQRNPGQVSLSSCDSSLYFSSSPHPKIFSPSDPYITQPFWLHDLLHSWSSDLLLASCTPHFLSCFPSHFLLSWSSSVWTLPDASGCFCPHFYNKPPQPHLGRVMAFFFFSFQGQYSILV